MQLQITCSKIQIGLYLNWSHLITFTDTSFSNKNTNRIQNRIFNDVLLSIYQFTKLQHTNPKNKL